ncbi:MAG: hypothetical protein JKY19_15765 [Alcanivoracaceae bacterium]|nr:hypothetical protein [Alcanivoracaceae bacterium]
MQAVKHSMKFMLTHSIVSFILVMIIMVFFSVFQILISNDGTPAIKAMMGALVINLTLSVFLGTYLGGALQSLKQNYLWTINQHYRNTLMAAYLIIIGLISLVQIPILYLNLNMTLLILLVPFCVAIFSSHMVLGKNLLHKILIPVFPLALYQLHRINVSLTVIIILLLIATLMLVIAMYLNRFYPDNSTRLMTKQSINSSTAVVATGLNLKWVTSFNYSIGVFMAKWVSRSKRNIDWAIIMPHTKLALFSLLYVLLIMLFVLMNNDKDKPVIEIFTVMFLSASIVSMVMESRQLIRQTRVFAHVFSGMKHRQLKNKILWSLDKTFILNSVVFIIAILLAAQIFSVTLNTSYVLFATLIVIAIALSFYPILLCLSWVNISLPLITAVMTYALLIFFSVRWLKTHTLEVMTSPYTIIFIVACLLLRVITQKIFWQRPIETLMKNK